MDRREYLKSVVGLGLGATTVNEALPAIKGDIIVPTVTDPVVANWNEPELYQRLISDSADEVVAFLEAIRKVNPEFPTHPACSMPFAALPLNVYARVDQDIYLKANIPPMPLMVELRNRIRAGQGLNDMCSVMKKLWYRWKPSYLYELENYPSNKELLVQSEPFADGRPSRPTAFPDRICTPRYVIDLAELDAYTLATMLCSPKLLAEEWDKKLKMAVEAGKKCPIYGDAPWEGDGWVSPLDVYDEVKETGINIERKAYMLEVFSAFVSGGVIYQVHPNKYEHPLSRQTDKDWLAARRTEPTHWPKVPFMEG